MKTKLIILPLLLIAFSFSLFAQKNIFKSIIEPFQENIVYKEKVFLHLNKSIYFTNENIWFTAYVSEDAENKPSIYTSNLHVSLLDVNGNVIEHKTLFVKEGVGLGDFEISNTLPSGKYFVQGFTNYMQNFGKENRYIQEIEIINSTSKEETLKVTDAQITNSYDLQVFPESGYLLENTQNVVGIKALINGKGFPFFGNILNSKGETVGAFSGNKLGMGKCEFNYLEDETYTATVNINNTTQKISLPKAIKEGVIFSLDNTNKDNVKLTLRTNDNSLPSLKDSNLTLLFYRNNFISQAVSLSLINKKELIQELIFDKSKLLNGLNIVTLFKNNKPIAERKFFVNKQQDQTGIIIEELQTKNDSTYFKIKTLNAKLQPTQANVSISILPIENKSFTEKQTIKSAFLLTPYIKGQIENPAIYFQNKNKNTQKYLDLLLLNQGWTSYSLEEKIKEINPIEKFKFETGFTINGKIKRQPKKDYNIGIMAKRGGLIASSEINENKEFTFENVFKYKNDSIKIALISNKNPLIKPSNVTFLSETTNNSKFSFIPKTINSNPIIKAINASSNEDFSIINFQNYPNVEVLKQVVLKDVKTKRKRNFYDDEMDIASNRKIMASGFYENHKVTERMGVTYLNLLNYFQTLGMVRGNCPDNCIIKLRLGPTTLLGGNPVPNIYLNGVRIDEESYIEVFETTFMDDVDEILINRSGAGGGIQGSGGIVKIFLKKANHKYYKYGKTLYKDLILLTGFDKSNDYFKPQYNLYTKDAFNWSEIAWKNNLKTDAKGEVIIKVPTNQFDKEFRFIINGFSDNGLLFNTNFKTSSNNI